MDYAARWFRDCFDEPLDAFAPQLKVCAWNGETVGDEDGAVKACNVFVCDNCLTDHYEHCTHPLCIEERD